jgi:hypothetical protein
MDREKTLDMCARFERLCSAGVYDEVDEEKLRDGARRFDVEGGLGFPLDPKRPLWYQKFSVW